jgi:hypothetical protein
MVTDQEVASRSVRQEDMQGTSPPPVDDIQGLLPLHRGHVMTTDMSHMTDPQKPYTHTKVYIRSKQYLTGVDMM